MDQEGGPVNSGVGSVLLLDSTIKNTQVGVKIRAGGLPSTDDTSGTLLLDNLKTDNVATIIGDNNGGVILGGGGATTIVSWGRGSVYQDESGKGEFKQDFLPAPQKSGNLLDIDGKFFEQTRPQYIDSNVDDFVSVKGEWE